MNAQHNPPVAPRLGGNDDDRYENNLNRQLDLRPEN